KGRIGRYHWESEPWWPDPPRPPPGAPNVVIVTLADVGFAQRGCFGSDSETPTLDALAARGLRYSHCRPPALRSPTRALLPAVPSRAHAGHQVDPPRSYEDGYHLTEDLVDRAVEFITDLRAVDAAKPFFLWFATGACHAPHQAPPEWVERYRGRFDSGWDAWREATLARQLDSGLLPDGTELSPRPEWVPAWDSLSEDERRLYARYMEAFAGFLSHTDHHLGRLVRYLDETRELDDTLLFVLSDNGASSEGGPTGS